MELFLKLIMLEKDKCLKKNSLNIFIRAIFFLFFCKYLLADSITEKENIIFYIDDLENFSANFIQSDGVDIEEGIIYIGKARVRADYLYPSKITIVMDSDKAMFVNHDLNEVQYFDPRRSSAGVFLDIFQNSSILYGSKIKIEDQSIILQKNLKNNNEDYVLTILFEKNPYILRKISLNYNGFNITLSLFNHNYDHFFEKKFFSLANPLLMN